MANASFKMNAVEVFSENNQTVTVKNINVAANDTTTPSMCKAWVNFNGTIDASSDTPANHFTTANNGIRAAYNVDYVIDHGQGSYEVHFENAMADANYCVLFTAGGQETTSTANFDVPARSTTPSTSSVRIMYSNGNQNTIYGQLAIFR